MMKIEHVRKDSIVDGWHCVDAQGRFGLLEDPQRAGANDTQFALHTIVDKSVAVFETRELPAERRKQIEAGRPEWLHAIVYAEPAIHQLPPVATINVEIGYSDDVTPEQVAFVAATVLEGQFDFAAAAFFVHLWGRGTYEVTFEFDWESETWSGDVIVQSLLDGYD